MSLTFVYLIVMIKFADPFLVMGVKACVIII